MLRNMFMGEQWDMTWDMLDVLDLLDVLDVLDVLAQVRRAQFPSWATEPLKSWQKRSRAVQSWPRQSRQP